MVIINKLRDPFVRIPPEGPLPKFNKYDIVCIILLNLNADIFKLLFRNQSRDGRMRSIKISITWQNKSTRTRKIVIRSSRRGSLETPNRSPAVTSNSNSITVQLILIIQMATILISMKPSLLPKTLPIPPIPQVILNKCLIITTIFNDQSKNISHTAII